MSERAISATVRGHVQGVFFRQETRREASSLGLTGWVRNRADGTVEVFAQGDRPSLDRLVDWLWVGPARAEVTGVEVEGAVADSRLSRFEIRN